MRIRYLLYFIFSGFLLFIVFISGSCEYHTDKEYFSNIEPNDSASIIIELNPSESAYYLAGKSIFSYKAFIDSLELYTIQIFVDTMKVAEMETTMGWFNLYAADYTHGDHVLTIVATTSSGSGSLADLLEAEGFIFSFSWNLYVDKSPPTAVQVTKVFNNSGVLQIEWEKYEQLNFGSYEVIKTTYYSDGDHYTTAIISIKDQNKSYFADSTYVGGKVEYSIKVLTPLNLAATGQSKLFEDEGFKLNSEWIEEDIVKLTWNKCKFPKAFKGYRIRGKRSPGTRIAAVDSNFLIYHMGIIGDAAKFELEVLAQNDENKGKVFSEIYQNIGYRIFDYDRINANYVNEFLYLNSSTKLFKFNSDTRIIIDSADLEGYTADIVLAPNDDALVLINPKRRYNPSDLSDFQAFNVNCGNLGCLSASSQGVVNLDGNWVLYDFLSLQVINVLSGASLKDKVYITEDNKYVLDVNASSSALTCYKLEGSKLTVIWWGWANSFSFIPGEPDKIMLLKDKMFEIRSITSNQVLSSFSVDALYIGGIDPSDNTAMFRMNYPDETLTIYNYLSGEKIKQMAISYSHPLRYIRGSVYSANGFEVPLNVKK